MQDFPNDLAYPFGGSEDETRYAFLEIHYDNPKLKQNLKDNSGMRLYVTKNYRKTEFGVLTVGSTSDWSGIILPPQAQSFTTNYGCRSDCTNVKPNLKFFFT